MLHHVTLARDLQPYAKADALCVIHAAARWVEPVQAGAFDFFTRLTPFLEERRVGCVVTTQGSELSEALLRQTHMHLMVGGPPLNHLGALHVAPAYLWGFWYLDEVGVNALSSMRFRSFDAAQVDAGKAEWFFNGVAGHMVRENVSRYQQPERLPYLEPARAVVFCQQQEHHRPPHHYLTTEQMIRNTARGAQGGKVYVKPHPDQGAEAAAALERVAATDPNVILSEASIHDLIAVSDCVVTQTSAVGFEALMHRKHVILTGRADYHHICHIARDDDGLRAAVRGDWGRMEDAPFAEYLYWFLSDHCVEPQREDFGHVVWNRMRFAAGLPGDP
ncbi:MAG: capsular polysaccharide export protein, LipB/KpsS family [Shimia sp.]